MFNEPLSDFEPMLHFVVGHTSLGKRRKKNFHQLGAINDLYPTVSVTRLHRLTHREESAFRAMLGNPRRRTLWRNFAESSDGGRYRCYGLRFQETPKEAQRMVRAAGISGPNADQLRSRSEA